MYNNDNQPNNLIIFPEIIQHSKLQLDESFFCRKKLLCSLSDRKYSNLYRCAAACREKFDSLIPHFYITNFHANCRQVVHYFHLALSKGWLEMTVYTNVPRKKKESVQKLHDNVRSADKIELDFVCRWLNKRNEQTATIENVVFGVNFWGTWWEVIARLFGSGGGGGFEIKGSKETRDKEGGRQRESN